MIIEKLVDFLLTILTPSVGAGVSFICLLCLCLRARHEWRQGGRGKTCVFASQIFCVVWFLFYYLSVRAGIVPTAYQIVIPRLLTLNLILQLAFAALFPLLVQFSNKNSSPN